MDWSLFGQFPNCRPNPSAVVVSYCVHTADATKQFRRVGVGGVYWALLTVQPGETAKCESSSWYFNTLTCSLGLYWPSRWRMRSLSCTCPLPKRDDQRSAARLSAPATFYRARRTRFRQACTAPSIMSQLTNQQLSSLRYFRTEHVPAILPVHFSMLSGIKLCFTASAVEIDRDALSV